MARNPSAITFDGTFKLADLGLAYVPAAETKQCQERRGRDVSGTQMYSEFRKSYGATRMASNARRCTGVLLFRGRALPHENRATR